MVRKEGQDEGKLITEVEGYEQIEGRIEDVISEYITSQEHIPQESIELDEIIVFGSYGCGMGVPGKSDLDIVLAFSSRSDPRSKALSTFLREAAGSVKYRETQIISGVKNISEIDVYAYPFLEVRTELQKMGQHEPVDAYYSLTDERKYSLY